MKKLWLLPVLLAACASAPAPGTPGMVYDDEGRPLAGVDVLAQGEWLARTDINGRFLIGGLPPAEKPLGRTLTFQKEGYEAGSVSLDNAAEELASTAVYYRMPSRDQLLKQAWTALDRAEYANARILLDRARSLGREDAFWALTQAALYVLDPSVPREVSDPFVQDLRSGRFGPLPSGWKTWWDKVRP